MLYLWSSFFFFNCNFVYLAYYTVVLFNVKCRFIFFFDPIPTSSNSLNCLSHSNTSPTRFSKISIALMRLRIIIIVHGIDKTDFLSIPYRKTANPSSLMYDVPTLFRVIGHHFKNYYYLVVLATFAPLY